MTQESTSDIDVEGLRMLLKIALVLEDPVDFLKCDDDDCTNRVHYMTISFAEGNCRKAYKGLYCKGENKNKLAVVKRFKEKSCFSIDDWMADLQAQYMAIHLANEWNKLGLTNKKLVVTSPEILKSPTTGELFFVEPYVEGDFQKWNSNSGWNSHQDASIHAFCHWTYHYMKGTLLFCDAQGVRGVTEYHLTDPCILSVKSNWGMTDCGPDYINNWFYYHKCNKFCDKNWLKPEKITKKVSIKVSKGTTYTHKFKTKYGQNNKNDNNISKNFMSIIEEDEEDWDSLSD